MAFDRRGGGDFRSFRRPRFGSSYDVPKPVKVGEEYDVEIAEVGSKGDGIARIKNFVVFVAGSKKGEKIKIKITDVGGRFATAEKVGAASETAAAAEVASESASGAEAKPKDEEAEEAEGSEESEGKSEKTEESEESEYMEIPEAEPKS